jgi:hypothetical protein
LRKPGTKNEQAKGQEPKTVTNGLLLAKQFASQPHPTSYNETTSKEVISC